MAHQFSYFYTFSDIIRFLYFCDSNQRSAVFSSVSIAISLRAYPFNVEHPIPYLAARKLAEPAKSIYSCDTIALNSGECFDLNMKNTSKVTDFYILSVYFRGIISVSQSAIFHFMFS